MDTLCDLAILGWVQGAAEWPDFLPRPADEEAEDDAA